MSIKKLAKVSKEVTFDCAHMLTGYNGACANLHGHTYKLEVTVGGEIQENGMVVDFAEMKKVLKKVTDGLDHAFVYNKNARDEKGKSSTELSIAGILNSQGLKTYPMESIVTAENMAKDIIYLILLHLEVPFVEVKLWETPTSYATVTVGGMPHEYF